MARRVVVTGAAGFLGAAVVRRLVAEGHDVLLWTRPTSDAWRLADLPRLPHLSLDVAGVLTDAGRATATAALAEFRPDALVHAAWEGVRGARREKPAQVENVAQAVEVLQLAAASGARRFVGLGSQAEYGPSADALSEESAARPTSAYGAAKLECGRRCLAEAARLGVSAAWVRVFSVYGPGQREGALVPDLARALREGRSLALGSGETPWDYLYEDDAADALARLACRDDLCGIFNLASGTAVPIGIVMHRVAALVDTQHVLTLGTRVRAPRDPEALRADVSRLREALGWRPTTTLDEGLARTVAAVLAPRGAARAVGPAAR
jgi:nucleoside-diphosphate-sugar epimerase